MTDSEFTMLMHLFETKEFRLDQLSSLLDWVDGYIEDPRNWARPEDLIVTLRDYYHDRKYYA